MYVDDVGGVSIDDELFDSSGREIWVLRDGRSVRQTRSFLHFEAAIGVILHFGHSDSIDKRDYPGLDSVFLGVTIDLELLTLSLSAAKALDYRLIVLSILESIPLPNGTVSVQPSVLSSLTHKLLHAASVAPLGRQHLSHVMRSARGEGALSGGVRVLSHAALRELRWWEQVLSQEAVRAGVPLASRTIFPIPSDPQVSSWLTQMPRGRLDQLQAGTVHGRSSMALSTTSRADGLTQKFSASTSTSSNSSP